MLTYTFDAQSIMINTLYSVRSQRNINFSWPWPLHHNLLGMCVTLFIWGNPPSKAALRTSSSRATRITLISACKQGILWRLKNVMYLKESKIKSWFHAERNVYFKMYTVWVKMVRSDTCRWISSSQWTIKILYQNILEDLDLSNLTPWKLLLLSKLHLSTLIVIIRE